MDITAWKFALKIFSPRDFFSNVAARGLLVKEKIRDCMNDFKFERKSFAYFCGYQGILSL